MRACAALVLCGVTSCSGSSARTAPNAAPVPESAPPNMSVSAGPATSGMFEYVARIKTTDIKGRFAISGKIVIFDLPDGACHPIETPDWTAATVAARYECRNAAAPEPVYFTIDVRNPMSRSTWQMTVKEQRQRSVCVEYANRGGRNVCVRTQTQTYDAVVPYSGSLFVRPAETRQPQPQGGTPFGDDDPSGAGAWPVPC